MYRKPPLPKPGNLESNSNVSSHTGTQKYRPKIGSETTNVFPEPTEHIETTLPVPDFVGDMNYAIDRQNYAQFQLNMSTFTSLIADIKGYYMRNLPQLASQINVRAYRSGVTCAASTIGFAIVAKLLHSLDEEERVALGPLRFLEKYEFNLPKPISSIVNIFGNIKTVAGVIKLENASVLLLNVLLRSLADIRMFMDTRTLTRAFAQTHQNIMLNFDNAVQNLGQRIAIWNTPDHIRFVKARIAQMLNGLQVFMIDPVTQQVYTVPDILSYANYNVFAINVHVGMPNRNRILNCARAYFDVNPILNQGQVLNAMQFAVLPDFLQIRGLSTMLNLNIKTIANHAKKAIRDLQKLELVTFSQYGSICQTAKVDIHAKRITSPFVLSQKQMFFAETLELRSKVSERGTFYGYFQNDDQKPMNVVASLDVRK